jgi:hypothetical protein
MFGTDDFVLDLDLLEETGDFVFKFNLSGGGLSESFLKVIDFLFELNDLVLLFVEDSSVIENSVLLSSWNVVNLAFQQALDF